MKGLLLEFFENEADQYVCRSILGALVDKQDSGRREFTFNRYEIELDFSENIAVVVDVLDANPAGACEVSLEEFEIRLRGWCAMGASGPN